MTRSLWLKLDRAILSTSRRMFPIKKSMPIRMNRSRVCLSVDQEPVAGNLDIDPAEPPEEVYWEDPIHTKP